VTPPDPARPIVFLHVPKTGGQTIHHALAGLVDRAAISPVRTHTQAPRGPQMPPGYSLYSGHIDWTELDRLPPQRFAFSALRDPRERIASFYFFLQDQARQRARAGTLTDDFRRALECSADDYFADRQPGWQSFIRDHFDNFYCSYFATRRVRGLGALRGLSPAEILARARQGLEALDAVYSTAALRPLEDEIRRRYGGRIRLVERYRNVGTLPAGQPRWPELLARLERDATRQLLESFVARDEDLIAGLPPPSVPPPGRWRRVRRLIRSRW
jgi:hypothetical protein